MNTAAKSIISVVTRNDDGTWWITVNPETPITTTISNFCRLTGCGRSKTYELLAEGTLDSIKIGKRRLIVLDSYHKLIERQRAAGATTRSAAGNSPANAATEIPEGKSRQPQMEGHPPGTPLYQIEAGLDSECYQRRNKIGKKSSAHHDAKGAA